MQVVYERCCGIDVHKRQVVACVLLTAADGTVQRHVQTFSTMTAELLALDDWLRTFAVEQIALESTGEFWRPIFNVVEDGRTIVLVNAQHMRAVPGRKTDVKDSEWIADLLRHGLLQPSFIPPKPIRELRELTRYRKTLVAERADLVNRVQKVLETANVKLAAVATDVLGKSGRAMLEAMVGGETDAATSADLARGRLRAKLPQLHQALEGRVEAHHRFLLARLLEHIEFLEATIQKVQEEIEGRLGPYAEATERLQTIPGVGERAAATIIAEIGVDMSRFPTAKHLASWAGLCPGNKESGGKRLSGKTRKGDVWLRAVLLEVAWAIAHTKDNYLAVQFRRLAQRRGLKRAALAIAHSVLGIIYYMLRDGTTYKDLGAEYFDQLDKAKIERHHVRRLEQLGYTVTLSPARAA
jgi:transposase